MISRNVDFLLFYLFHSLECDSSVLEAIYESLSLDTKIRIREKYLRRHFKQQIRDLSLKFSKDLLYNHQTPEKWMVRLPAYDLCFDWLTMTVNAFYTIDLFIGFSHPKGYWISLSASRDTTCFYANFKVFLMQVESAIKCCLFLNALDFVLTDTHQKGYCVDYYTEFTIYYYGRPYPIFSLNSNQFEFRSRMISLDTNFKFQINDIEFVIESEQSPSIVKFVYTFSMESTFAQLELWQLDQALLNPKKVHTFDLPTLADCLKVQSMLVKDVFKVET